MDKCGETAEQFKNSIRLYMDNVATRVDKLRERQSAGKSRTPTKVELELERLTLSQLVEFFETCREKFIQAKIEPGNSLLTC